MVPTPADYCRRRFRHLAHPQPSVARGPAHRPGHHCVHRAVAAGGLAPQTRHPRRSGRHDRHPGFLWRLRLPHLADRPLGSQPVTNPLFPGFRRGAAPATLASGATHEPRPQRPRRPHRHRCPMAAIQSGLYRIGSVFRPRHCQLGHGHHARSAGAHVFLPQGRR